MDKLTVSLVQTDLHWEDIDQNLNHFTQLLTPLQGKTDLVILPEMFTTGFTMKPEKLAEKMNGPTVSWLKSTAVSLDCVVVGSLIIQEDDHYYNRLFWMNPSGEYGTYDKRHLFRLGDENLHYTHGKSQLIRNIGEWRIKSLICYDLRFPVWSRNRNDYDLLVYIANWPESRREVWKTLLKARAIENQAFVIGVNRIGSDGNGIDYSGDSMVVDPKGNAICCVEPYMDRTDTVTLSLKEVKEFRKKFPVCLDADDFELTL